MDNNFIVYIHIRPDINEPFYVGMGVKGREKSLCGRNKFWKNIVNKNNGKFIIKILYFNLNEEEALIKERETELDLRNKGYKLTNIMECGIKGKPLGSTHSEETIKKLKNFWKEYYKHHNNSNKGKKQSEETCRKKSESMKGKKTRLGKKDSEETKKKKSIGLKNRDPKWKEKAYYTKERNDKIKDKSIYHFINIKLNKSFIGNRVRFMNEFNLNYCSLSSLITGKRLEYKNWIKYGKYNKNEF